MKIESPIWPVRKKAPETTAKVWKLLEFRESNVFTYKVTKELFSRKKITVRENFAFIHTVRTAVTRNSLPRKFFFVKSM